jgi:hypothetical protein
VPCSSSTRSFGSLVDILGEATTLPVECQGEQTLRSSIFTISAVWIGLGELLLEVDVAGVVVEVDRIGLVEAR